MLHFLLTLSLILLFPFSSFQPIAANTEVRALMDIKAALDPENNFLKTWTSDGDPCSGSFEGVACNDHRKVANISLQGKGLSGRLSPAIAGLKCLSGLYLHYNSLTGEIPSEIANLTELTDLYLNVNNLSGSIPLDVGNMGNLQVLQLCCNQLKANIPAELGSLKKLSVLALQYNQLIGTVPPSLGNLIMLKRLDLSYNHLSGPIPTSIAVIPELQILDVRNNSLSGFVPAELKRLNGGFSYGNNSGLCGKGFSTLRDCSAFDDADIPTLKPFGLDTNHTTPKFLPESETLQANCSHYNCSKSSRFPAILIVVGVLVVAVTLVAAGSVAFIRCRRQKQKIGSSIETADGRFIIDQANDLYYKSSSPLGRLAYSVEWDPPADGLSSDDSSQEVLQRFRLHLEDVESATQYFSDANVLGRGNFSTVYRGVLRDGSVVAIKSINVTSCKSEEEEFVKGLKLLISLRHENLVSVRGFCCSRGRGECFLVFDFASNGNLSRYLDGSDCFLDWPTRVSIINGIAKGIQYLHEDNASKPPLLHQNMSADKILIDEKFNPLISDSGLRKILADDIIFSALKVSAAMGYLAPEYVTTGRFTDKSDVYAFGVIVLQILSGKQKLTNSARSAAESCDLKDLIDPNLSGKFSIFEAAKLAKLAAACTHELSSERPTMEMVIQELNKRSSGT
ncbi:hypothetical protein Nepgr_011337 [Nepenthes gracilis]|uniref:Protein kinase domain-containing protein n=1 Tax=Nepenthes gracilis TaxID=150966 RepID=A0AAD3XMB2_NEPGR|nr:hypothetical protein Nepgr_011337 [Nepenthes gracilis]